MHYKKMIGPIAMGAIGLGLCLIGYGVYLRTSVSGAALKVHEMSQSDNRIVKSMGKKMESSMGHYGSKMRVSLYGGVLLIVAGAAVVYLLRRKHH